MRYHSSLIDGLFTSGNSLEYRNPVVESFERLYIDEVGRGFTVLRNQNRFLVPLKIGDDLRGLAFEGGHQLSSHEVIL